MNRRDFQTLARVRQREAQSLVVRRQWDGAYYLAGYVVECALKACIAKQTRRFDFPPRGIQDIYTHDLGRLLTRAGLENELEQVIRSDPQLGRNWAIVASWAEESRYERKSAAEATDLLDAITDTDHGVFGWLEHHW